MNVCEECGKPIPRSRKICEDCERGIMPADPEAEEAE